MDGSITANWIGDINKKSGKEGMLAMNGGEDQGLCRFVDPGSNETSKPTAKPSDRATTSGKVLVVEDEEMVRNLNLRFLRRLGYETLSAANGEEALALFQTAASEIVCVLLDVNMPRMNGVNTLRQIKVVRSNIPVILCSGSSDQDALQQFADEGVAGFIQKPFQLEKLKAELNKVMQASG